MGVPAEFLNKNIPALDHILRSANPNDIKADIPLFQALVGAIFNVVPFLLVS